MDTDNIRNTKTKALAMEGFHFHYVASVHHQGRCRERHQEPNATLRPHYVVRTNWRDRMRLLLLPLRHEPLYAKFFAAKSQFTMFQ